MTTAGDLLNELAGAGVAVTIAADDPWVLDLDGPVAALTPGLVKRVKAHKPELLALLRGDCAPRAAQNHQNRSVLSAAPEVGRVGQPDAPEPLGAYDGRHELSLAERVETGYVNPGWTPRAWAERLCQLADRCEALRPALAAQYRSWAANVAKNEKALA